MKVSELKEMLEKDFLYKGHDPEVYIQFTTEKTNLKKGLIKEVYRSIYYGYDFYKEKNELYLKNHVNHNIYANETEALNKINAMLYDYSEN